uniref:DC1 domain-containing protein n=1 Tax=Noccaea caerulescens TaxID=107243 RepID=A0A1J3H005_NOCCA
MSYPRTVLGVVKISKVIGFIVALSVLFACGLVNVSEPSYICFQCNYVSHQSCLDLPRVIKITRHSHRLSHTPYRSPEISPCRVCYKNVDIKHGQYSCNHEDCSYVVHSKCATHDKVWDGRELEWETEEPDNETEDIAPFRKLGDDFIKHFSHRHRLKLKKHDGVRDTEKQCRACVYPIVSPQFCHCRKCNYSLHEVCAGLPRKLDHALHRQALILDPSPLPRKRFASLYCSACSRATTGFRYICSIEIAEAV